MCVSKMLVQSAKIWILLLIYARVTHSKQNTGGSSKKQNLKLLSLYRGRCISAHVSLNLFNELGKRGKMLDLLNI